jgi:glycosyltransferase involved in cell wall biosynthesis
VIPRGVDVANYQPHYRPDDAWMTTWRQQYPELENCYVVTLPGRVSHRKGVLDLIRIIAALKAQGIAAHGTLTGFRDDVREIMAVSSAVLSLSLQPEAFGRTVNEALGLGVPVAGYAHGGVGEQLAQHFPAGLVPPGDVNAMAERLLEWSATPPSMDDVQVYALQDMLDSTLVLYRGLVAPGQNASRNTSLFPGLSK